MRVMSNTSQLELVKLFVKLKLLVTFKVLSKQLSNTSCPVEKEEFANINTLQLHSHHPLF